MEEKKTNRGGKETPQGKMQYRSPNTGEYVSESQYITEVFIKKVSEKEGTNLVNRYWLDPKSKWTRKYRFEITNAASLLTRFSVRAIMQGIDDWPWAKTLTNKNLERCIEKRQAAINEIEKKAIKEEIKTIAPNPSSFSGGFKKNPLMKKGL